MNREEIEKLLEESGRQARKENKGQGKRIHIEKIRKVLNALFLVGAAAGIILYYALPDDSRFTGLAIISIAMLLKVVEFFLRFMF